MRLILKAALKGATGKEASMLNLLLPFNELPVINEVDDSEFKRLMIRYGHSGCPGISFNDVCAEPVNCASKNICRIVHEARMQSALKP